MGEAMPEHWTLTVNGEAVTVEADGATPLLTVLRNQLDLTGARFGCGDGSCGACTVMVDDRPVTSCDAPIEWAAGRHICTVEGLATDGGMHHPVQTALLEAQAGQCGYCLTGIVMRAVALLRENDAPTRAEIAAALDRHLCRCGTQARILRAIASAADTLRDKVQEAGR
jgi:nicotinate dehydrogenase subunit A